MKRIKMKKVKIRNIFRGAVTKKLLRKELAALLLKNEYLKSQLIKYREREEGFGELINLYCAVIAYVGASVEVKKSIDGKGFDEKMSEILSLLRSRKFDYEQ